MDEVTETQQYDGDGVTLTTENGYLGKNGVNSFNGVSTIAQPAEILANDTVLEQSQTVYDRDGLACGGPGANSCRK